MDLAINSDCATSRVFVASMKDMALLDDLAGITNHILIGLPERDISSERVILVTVDD